MTPAGSKPAPGQETQSFIPEDVTVNNYYARNERSNQAEHDSASSDDADLV
jgi:hypothetical protein